MTRESGIKPENPDGQNMVVIQKGSDIELIAEFTYTTDRKIKGCAHFPRVDRENEFILSDAIEKALPDFMQHPILHYQHTERPVGVLEKAEINNGALYVEGSIFDTSDTDDVWREITSTPSRINKFSIYGKRLHGSPECSVSPTVRTSPCITKAMVLYSISVVGPNAMNPDTYLVAKGGGSTPVAESEKEKEKEEKEEVEKSDEQPAPMQPELATSESNISSVLKRIGDLEKAVAGMNQQVPETSIDKGEDKEMEEDKKEEVVEKCNDTKMKKAEEPEKDLNVEVSKAETAEPAPEFIVKATLDGEMKKALDMIDTIQKAYDTLSKEHADLKSKVEKMEQFTIQKGGTVVLINDTGISNNPMLNNLKAVEG